MLLLWRSAPLASPLGLKGVNAQILWIAPLVDAALFLLVALPLIVACRLLRKPCELPALGASFFLSFFGLAILPHWLHRWAALSLAAGLTLVALRWLRPRLPRIGLLAPRVGIAVCATWLLLLALLAPAPRAREQWAAWRQPAALADAPNVLFIVMDTVRADHLSAYGYHRPTSPHLERLAAEGVLFSRAFSTSSWTLPSHASLFTGLLPLEHSPNRGTLPESNTTLAELLAAEGYATGAFVANTLMAHHGTGLAQGFQRYEDFFHTPLDALGRTTYGRRIVPRVASLLAYHDIPGRKRAGDVNRAFLRWLDGRGSSQRPFFAFLNYFEAHFPYFPAPQFAARFSNPPERILQRKPMGYDWHGESSPLSDQQQAEIDAYDAAIADLDAKLGELFDELRRRGLLDKTILVVTSDHGESLFEHGALGHSMNLHLEQLRIPLLLRWPAKVPAGIRHSGIVDLRDVPRMVTELAGTTAPLPGREIALAHDDSPACAPEAGTAIADLGHNPWAPLHWQNRLGSQQSVITARWHLIQTERKKTELYDWCADPQELRDLSETVEGKSLTQQLRAHLGTKTERSQEAAHLPPGDQE